jgi:hypothetical protein
MFNACENGRPLKSQNVQAMNQCQVKSQVHEDIDSCEFFFFLVVPGVELGVG